MFLLPFKNVMFIYTFHSGLTTYW